MLFDGDFAVISPLFLCYFSARSVQHQRMTWVTTTWGSRSYLTRSPSVKRTRSRGAGPSTRTSTLSYQSSRSCYPSWYCNDCPLDKLLKKQIIFWGYSVVDFVIKMVLIFEGFYFIVHKVTIMNNTISKNKYTFRKTYWHFVRIKISLITSKLTLTKWCQNDNEV